MSSTTSQHVQLTSVCREEPGAQCLVVCPPMAPPPLLPALCYDHARYTRASSSLLHMTSAPTPHSHCAKSFELRTFLQSLAKIYLFDQSNSNTQPSLEQLHPEVGSRSPTSQQHHLSSRRASVTTPISPTSIPAQQTTTGTKTNTSIWPPHPRPSRPPKQAPPQTPHAQPAPTSPTAQSPASPSTAANPASSQPGGVQPSTQPAATKLGAAPACNSFPTVRPAPARARARRARPQALPSTRCRLRARGA